MPFRRRRRRTRRRRRFRGRRMRRRLVINPERKNLDNTGTLSPTSSGVAVALNVPSQGSGVNQRQGRSITILSVLLNWCTIIDSDNVIPMCYRVSLVLDRQPNSTAVTLTDIYNGVGSILAPMSVRNLEQGMRFKVLKTRTFRLGPAQTSATGKFFKRLHINTRQNGAGGGIATAETNVLYLILMADQAANPPVTTFVSRLRFIG